MHLEQQHYWSVSKLMQYAMPRCRELMWWWWMSCRPLFYSLTLPIAIGSWYAASIRLLLLLSSTGSSVQRCFFYKSRCSLSRELLSRVLLKECDEARGCSIADHFKYRFTFVGLLIILPQTNPGELLLSIESRLLSLPCNLGLYLGIQRRGPSFYLGR